MQQRQQCAGWQLLRPAACAVAGAARSLAYCLSQEEEAGCEQELLSSRPSFLESSRPSSSTSLAAADTAQMAGTAAREAEASAE